MPILIYIALLAWLPITLILFALLPPRRAAVVGIVAGQLFLPPAAIPISGLPDWDKWTASTVSIVLATLIFQPNRLLEFRLRWFDIPALAWSIAPMMASLSNGLGPYDGLAGSMTCMGFWAFPYFVGRLWFTDHEGLRELAIGLVCGGLAYIPLILLELRLSPFLKGMVYGIYRWEGVRFGGYRPFVFLTTGLELGMFMTGVSLAALWLWRSKALKEIRGFSFGTVCLPIVLVVTLLCRSSGALVLLIIGYFAIWCCTRFNTKFFFYALLLVSPLYYSVRMSNLWTGDNLVSFIEKLDPERAQSLGFRFACENVLIGKALQQPAFGWGSWGRNKVVGPDGKDWTVTDGVWIIYLGCYGCLGLFSWTGILFLPALLFALRHPLDQWKTAEVGPAAVMATILCLYNVDCLLNGFINQIYVVGAGGLIATMPMKLRRSTASSNPAETQQSTWSDGPSQVRGPTVDQASMAELYLDGNESVTNPVAIPQLQLASRYQELARTLKSQGLPAESRAAWVHALDLLTEAATKYRELPELRKRRCACANDLAWFLINEPDAGTSEFELALRQATEITQIDPQSAAYWNTLGAACYRAGKPHDAIAALERSMELTAGGTGFDFVFLSLAHAQIGDHEQAQHWKAQADSWIAEFGSNNSELARLRQQAGECLAARSGPPTRV